MADALGLQLPEFNLGFLQRLPEIAQKSAMQMFSNVNAVEAGVIIGLILFILLIFRLKSSLQILIWAAILGAIILTAGILFGQVNL